MIKNIADRIRGHFAAHEKRSKWPFFWRITVENLFLSGISGLLLFEQFHLPERTDIDLSHPIRVFIAVVILAPFFETILFQTLPVAIAKKFGARHGVQLAAATIPFALAHMSSGIGTMIAAGLVGGFYFAFTYIRWRERSLETALWMTCGMHAAHNLVVLSLALLLFKEGR